MTTLNKRAAETLTTFGDAVHACTDVTGFGLVGHSTEMAVGSHASLAIEFSRLPIFPGALEIASANRSGGMGTNKVQFAPTADTSALSDAEVDLCFDPQTSGGLLASVDAASADAILGALVALDVAAAIIGTVTTRGGSFVSVRR